MVENQKSLGGGSFVTEAGCDVSVERRFQSTGGGSSLVILTAQNDGEEAVSITIHERVFEDGPEVQPIRSPHNQSGTWNVDEGRIEHRIDVPADEERLVIYEISFADGDPELYLSQPSVTHVEEVALEPGEGSSSTADRREASPGDPPDRPEGTFTRGANSPSEERSPRDTGTERLEARIEERSDRPSGRTPDGRDPARAGFDGYRDGFGDPEAFADVLAAFLDDHGSSRDVMDALQESIDANDGELDPRWTVTLETVTNLARLRAEHDETTASTESAIESLREEVDSLTDSVATAEDRADARFEEVADAIDAVRDDVTALEEVVGEYRAKQRRIASALVGEGDRAVDTDDPFEEFPRREEERDSTRDTERRDA